MLQGIPAGVVGMAYGPDGSADLVPVLLGMLPAVWSLESAASSRPPEVAEGWRLLPRLEKALEWFRRLDGKSLAKMRAALRDEQEQGGLDLGDTAADAPALEDPLAWALGVAIVKAAGRANPAEAVAGYLRPFVSDALRTGPGEDLFGASADVNPGAVLLAHVDRRMIRKNPPRGSVRHSRGGTVVRYPGGVEVRFRRRVEDPLALSMADAHYLEALEGQGALFGGLGRESTIHQSPPPVVPEWATAKPGDGPGPWPWLRLPVDQWGELRAEADRKAVSAVALGPVWLLEGMEGGRIRPGEPVAGMDQEAERLRSPLRGSSRTRWMVYPAGFGAARVGNPSRRIDAKIQDRKNLW